MSTYLAYPSLNIMQEMILFVDLGKDFLKFAVPIIEGSIENFIPLLRLRLLLLLLGPLGLKVHIICVRTRSWKNSCEVVSSDF